MIDHSAPNVNVSVIITNHNKGELVAATVDSVVGQLNAEDEIILVDDASDDDCTLSVYSMLLESGQRVTHHKTSRRLGAAGAKNVAVSLSSNDYIVLLDADDVLPTTAIEKIKFAFQGACNASVVFGDYTENREGSEPARYVAVSSLVDQQGWLDPSRLTSSWTLLGSSPFTKAAFLAVGGFDARHPVTDDVDFFRRLFAAGFRARYIPSSVYQWNRGESGNSSMASARLVARAWFRNLSFYWTFLRKRFFFAQLLQQCLTVITGKKGHVDRVYRAVFHPRSRASTR